MTYEKEETLAQQLLKHMTYHTAIKFTKTGSAACEAAVRYARTATGR
jgi:glutamate-1-semialdehyde aminotransferase